MSDTSADKLIETVASTLLKVVWRQWATLGVTISQQNTDSRSAIDPEALLLATATLLDQEPRLRDVVASWLTTRPGTLSVQRIGNLAKRFPVNATAMLPTLAVLAFSRGKDHRWRPLATSGGARDDFGDRRKDLIATRPYRPAAAILLQLRAGMGVGVKADVLAYLISVGSRGMAWATVSSIAEILAYTPAAVRRAADDMVEAHFVIAPDAVDRHSPAPRMYRAESAHWGTVLGLTPGTPGWTRWDQHFALATKLIARWRQASGRTISDYAFATMLRESLTEHPRGLASERPDAEPVPDGPENMIPYFERRLAEWDNWVTATG